MVTRQIFSYLYAVMKRVPDHTSRTLRAIAIAAILVASGGAARSLEPPAPWMDATALKAAFSGVTIEGFYADGRPFEESYESTGRLRYVEELRNRIQLGYWSIVQGTFCTIYDAHPTGGCFRVRQHSANCFEFYFQARTEDEARKPDLDHPSWTARAWRKGVPSTCDEKPVA
jgi:hypothetical protein